MKNSDNARPHQLSGTIPTSLTRLTHLQQLFITDNKLYGEFPIEIFTMPSINRLELSNTGLDIKFPPIMAPTITRLYVISTKYPFQSIALLFSLFPFALKLQCGFEFEDQRAFALTKLVQNDIFVRIGT